MGLKPSKIARAGRRKNKSVVDEDTGLTLGEKDRIRSSWSSAMKIKKRVGVAIFIKFFTDHPSVQDLFDQFRGKSIEEIQDSSEMKAHGLRFMATINSLVENLDDIAVLQDMLKNIARSHHTYHVLREYFEIFGQVIPETIQAELGPKFNEKTKDAWNKVLTVFAKAIHAEYDHIEGIVTDTGVNGSDGPAKIATNSHIKKGEGTNGDSGGVNGDLPKEHPNDGTGTVHTNGGPDTVHTNGDYNGHTNGDKDGHTISDKDGHTKCDKDGHTNGDKDGHTNGDKDGHTIGDKDGHTNGDNNGDVKKKRLAISELTIELELPT